MPESPENSGPQKPKSTWDKIPFFAKLILAACAIGILYFFIWGSSSADILGFAVRVFILAIMSFLAYFIIKRFLSFLEPKPFSAKENLHSRIVNLATVAVPENIVNRKLIAVGSSGFQGTPYGNITGFLRLPYFVGTVKRDENGEVVFKKDEKGNPTKVPDREFTKSKTDSEYFFVVKKGRLFPKFFYVRCHQKYVMSMDGDVFLRTSNLVPIMSSNYAYPYEQIFEDASRIMLQNMNEIVITTFDHQHDLISNTTDHALSFNPHWEYARRIGQETITNPQG